ncbi:nitric oxide synthase oxygenase [Sediminibacillus massiliensis]|uniref:nitric oxide synthase oxygenase n=1 Tax=Sediminibacillus massiliensis TaxID=1926277 RepID=UPI0009888408|nr:nitric oxide synthase oxygenase [Sediminibacillus massiliensis]
MKQQNSPDKHYLLEEAATFIRNSCAERNAEAEAEPRIRDAAIQIEAQGYYEHTWQELEQGAKAAWRNSNKCIGRLFWDRLQVIDGRGIRREEEIVDKLLEHIKKAANHGKIQPMITVFDPHKPNQDSLRIWNHQLLRYAGYETADGIIGDPDSIEFTKACIELGWQGKGSHFDLLPLVVQKGNKPPYWREIPSDIVLEVPIEHDKYSLFGNFEVKWYGVPIISDMSMEIGGIVYPCAPFNGWYMGTEIGARNLADEKRYNLLPLVAESLGLDTKRNSSLWKDEAMLELNKAVLNSFKKHGVNIVDHHTAASQFRIFEQKEQMAGRKVTGQWSWLIPPMSPSATHIFHKRYDNTLIKPNYFYQSKPF